MESNFVYNEKLKFSWGHIIASIALIAIAYCTFVGMVYLTKGQFILSGAITLAIIVLLVLIFMIPQQLKATDHRFEKRIKWERTFVFASPVLFIVLMVPFAHSWTVHFRQDKILKSFDQVLTSTSDMFSQYEQYSNNRVLNYSNKLEESYPDSLSRTCVNKQEVLRLVLLSTNYDTLKTASNNWMEMAINKKISTWNIFLLGNISEIKEAIHEWYGCLQDFSKISLREENNPAFFDQSGQCIQEIDHQIAILTGYYDDIIGFNPLTLLWLVLGYAMLMLPYLIQGRHSKTIGTRWTLFGFRKEKPVNNDENQENIDNQRDNSSQNGGDQDTFALEDNDCNSLDDANNAQNEKEDDDYKTISI